MSFHSDYTKHLPREWFTRDTASVAKDLVGAEIVFFNGENLLAARIVETEAYLGEGDHACHAARGQTKRNGAMFEQGGVLYVYHIYGIHRCANVVTDAKAKGCAVLLRAAEPLLGTELMIKNRECDNERMVLRGPGNLAKAFGFGIEHNYARCDSSELWFQKRNNNFNIETTTRIGISASVELPLRFILQGSEYVSGKRGRR